MVINNGPVPPFQPSNPPTVIQRIIIQHCTSYNGLRNRDCRLEDCHSHYSNSTQRRTCSLQITTASRVAHENSPFIISTSRTPPTYLQVPGPFPQDFPGARKEESSQRYSPGIHRLIYQSILLRPSPSSNQGQHSISCFKVLLILIISKNFYTSIQDTLLHLYIISYLLFVKKKSAIDIKLH